MADLQRGLYEQVVTDALHQQLERLDPGLVERDGFEYADAPDLLSRHIAALLRRTLRILGEKGADDAQRVARQVEAANRVARLIAELTAPEGTTPSALNGESVHASSELLMAIARDSSPGLPGLNVIPLRPRLPLSSSALLDNRTGSRIGRELAGEFPSADRVDLICAFLKWSGLQMIREPLADFLGRGGQLRILTTTYLGATDLRAVEELARMGAQIKISYDTLTTRLHAKAWHFYRETGYSTAYVGSSNLSKAALTDGLEWNVRLAQIEAPHLLTAFADNFTHYWDGDSTFEPYDPECDHARLAEALRAEKAGPHELPLTLTTLDVNPYPYQQEVLDELDAERSIHGRTRNLVVMATGTGKTIVAALDYRRLRAQGLDSLLFVAHRQEILTNSLATFRHVLHDPAFGELFAAGERPARWQHVFASVQSLAGLELAAQLPPERFDVVVVDEFHHAQATTYARLLRHVDPRILLGLTATPERSDGQDVTSWFGGRIAVDLRLWEAIERGMLAPFHYFGVSDGTDLTAIRFSRSTGYDVGELTNFYTGNDARVMAVLHAVQERVEDPRRMRALGFCVSVAHADYMAAKFTEAGISARSVTSNTPAAERDSALRELRDGTVQVLFSVDLFNEGVDVPALDTVLFLRPTQSATVFLQQLGRGLRRSADKSHLTALDFIGHQHEHFRFDPRFRALTNTTRPGLERAINDGFPSLPPGCHVHLDAVATRTVLDNIRGALRTTWKSRIAELKQASDPSLMQFLTATGTELEDLYRGTHGTWSDLREAAGLPVAAKGPQDKVLESSLRRMLHIDDPERLAIMETLASGETPEPTPRNRRLVAMIDCLLWNAADPGSPLEDTLRRLIAEPRRTIELSELAPVLRDRIHRATRPVQPTGSVPLHTHATYSKNEALLAFGKANPQHYREGVWWNEAEAADVFFVTLSKSEKHYSESTRYQDRILTPELFQWETQSRVSQSTPTAQRYIHHAEHGSSVHLFLRNTKQNDGRLGAPPYLYAGTMSYVAHHGDTPVSFTWRLATPLPTDYCTAAAQLAA